MFRLLVVVAVVGLLLADPVLCRVEAAAAPCAGACRSWHESSEAGHDSAHGCICQGATGGAEGKVSAALDASGLLSATARALPILLLRGRGWERLRPLRVPAGAGGRSLRIARQSFLF